MDDKLMELQKQIEEKKQQEQNIFEKKEVAVQSAEVVDTKAELINSMFEQAVVHEVANNQDLKETVLETAEQYTKTKMDVIKTNVNTEQKEAFFNNNKDACESYGFNEKTTPAWAIKFMRVGYNIILAIYLFVASFTVMPIIFLSKKIVVGVKHTWVAVFFAFIVYLAVTLTPVLLAILR